MERPGTFAPLRNDFEYLRDQGVGGIVSLTERPLPQALLEEFGFVRLHLPVIDFTPPTPNQLDRFMAFWAALEKRKTAVAVHCGAGLGRTGTVLACAFVFQGLNAEHAIDRVRTLRPYSVETRPQEECVRDYAERLRKRKKENIPLFGEAAAYADDNAEFML
jgi:atypical dual specificity phosphatase